ncbi:propionyl-CoA synthetase (plasmid) [Rhizorhabdus wittichii DC-6]|nr:propionyl-CoA synthetase [Rhizorhabdus wittichii DC-6]
MHNYKSSYTSSIRDPAGFWLEAAQQIDWDVLPNCAFLKRPDGLNDWFAGGMLNTCFNAVDRHVDAGRGDQTALIYDSAMTSSAQRLTYRELLENVRGVAGMMANAGIVSGDRVIIYMPMVPEAVFAMLACARIGAIHSVVFGGFAANELAKRIDDAKPKLVLTASCGLEPGRIIDYKTLLDRALDLASHDVGTCIVLQRPQLEVGLVAGRDHDWAEAVLRADPVECVSVPAAHPLYILYTSGTTGIPKGVVHDNGGHAVALAWSMANIYGLQQGETFWAGSDIGWAVGHSYIVYGPLLHGCTTILYEGKPVGTPDAGAFWRVIREHGVDIFFTAPTAIRAIKRDDPKGHHVAASGVGKLRALFLAGERADPDTLTWAEAMLGIPVIDHWWQTELGWPAAATCLGLGAVETRHGSAGHPVPGYDFAVLDEDGLELAEGHIGSIVIRLPLPPGTLTTLWEKPEHFQEAYLDTYPGYYMTGDAGMIDTDGYLHIMSRIDDIINVAGHRLSTGSIEQIISSHPDVAECAVIGAADAIKGMIPIGLVVLKKGISRPASDICREVVKRVRDELGPVAAFKSVGVVEQLPKTRSGKILRVVIRKLADGQPVTMPATIDDPAAIESVRIGLQSIGYGQDDGLLPREVEFSQEG